MTAARISVAISMVLAAALAPACASKVITTHETAAPAPVVTVQSHDTIVLLPDDDTGVVGRATVSNAFGTIDLAGVQASTRVFQGRQPSALTTLPDEDVRRMFGPALSALPAAPLHFTLYFGFESDELTSESRTHLPEILNATRDRPVPEVIVIGHTDTAGPAARNLQLGLRRANRVRDLLLATRVDSSTIEVVSHGETDALILTADDVFEPRNRRVEITVR